MYAVIFKATLKPSLSEAQLEEYLKQAQQLRDRARCDYGCLNFVSHNEGLDEIAISYWADLAAISQWKQDSLHREAQEKGKSEWYQHYTVEVVNILRQYHHPD